MRKDREYDIYLAIAKYMKLQYPNVIYRFDMAGNNLSKAAAGKNKAIQNCQGYPDLFICQPNSRFHGCFIEIKKEGEQLFKKRSYVTEYKNDHLTRQASALERLQSKGYYAVFSIGFDMCKETIDWYLNIK